MNSRTPNGPHAPLSPRERIDILLEEYRSLYGLAQLRIVALDRRSSVAVAAFATFLGTFSGASADAQLALMLGLQPGIVWFVRTTRSHAHAFEDAIRRIDQIERTVNDLAGTPLLGFQSSHPSRGRAVGGRTGAEAMLAVMIAALLILAASAAFALERWDLLTHSFWWIEGYTAATALYVVRCYWSYSRYRYTRSTVVGAMAESGAGT